MRKDPEHQEQKALVKRCRLETLRDARYGKFYAIPNGGKRHRKTAARMKAEGQTPGIPDLHWHVCVHHDFGGSRKMVSYHGLYIEMKAGKGKASKKQLAKIEELRRDGYAVMICYGWEEAFATLQMYLGDLL